MRISGNPKITLRFKARAFASKLCAFFILAIFGFPLKYPFPRGTFAHRSRPRKVPSSKSAVIRRGLYRISPKRGWARCNRNLIHKKLLFILTFGMMRRKKKRQSNCSSHTRRRTEPKNRSRNGYEDAPKEKDDNFCRPFAFGLVLSERFSAQTSRIPEAQYPLRS